MAVESLVGSKHDFNLNEPCQNNEIPLFAEPVDEEQARSTSSVVQDGIKTQDDFGVSLQIGGNGEQDKGIMFKIIEFTDLSESEVLGVQLQEFELARVSDDKTTLSIQVTDIEKNSVAFADGRLKIGDCILKINDHSLTALSTNEAGYINTLYFVNCDKYIRLISYIVVYIIIFNCHADTMGHKPGYIRGNLC